MPGRKSPSCTRIRAATAPEVPRDRLRHSTRDPQGEADADRDDPRLDDRLPRLDRRQRRAADDPGGPRHRTRRPAVDRRGLHAHPGLPAARRRLARRPLRAPADVRHRPRAASRSPRSSARSRPPTRRWSAPRALQGIAGALLVPGSLAILAATFEGEARGRAVGLWTAWAGISTLIGPAGRRPAGRARLALDLLGQPAADRGHRSGWRCGRSTRARTPRRSTGSTGSGSCSRRSASPARCSR